MTVTPQVDVTPAAVGSCQMVPVPATDFITVYTIIRKFQAMFHSPGQDWTYTLMMRLYTAKLK